MNREIKFKCFYEGKIYNVISIDFSYKKINLSGGDIIDFKDGQLMEYTRKVRC